MEEIWIVADGKIRQVTTVQDASEYCGMHEQTVYSWIRAKHIDTYTVAKRVLIDFESLNRWLGKENQSND